MQQEVVGQDLGQAQQANARANIQKQGNDIELSREAAHGEHNPQAVGFE
jgi:hypothetical protein